MKRIENDVVTFFNKALGKEVTIKSALNDLCPDEDDAFFLLAEFFENFEIDKGCLDLDKYFYPTPYWWERIKLIKKKQELKPKLTIEHLIAVVKKKEWFDPVDK